MSRLHALRNHRRVAQYDPSVMGQLDGVAEEHVRVFQKRANYEVSSHLYGQRRLRESVSVPRAPAFRHGARMTDNVLIFIVEDEILIQDALRDALEDGGYDVLAASQGKDAIEKIESNFAECSALITDVNIAGSSISGWDIGKRARELKPEIPVIYMTGASAHEWPSHGVPNSVLLTKPFAPAQVVTAVSNLINEAARLRAVAAALTEE